MYLLPPFLPAVLWSGIGLDINTMTRSWGAWKAFFLVVNKVQVKVCIFFFYKKKTSPTVFFFFFGG